MVAKLVACGLGIVWSLCLVEGLYGEVSDGVVACKLDLDVNLQIRDVSEHYVDLVRVQMVKVNYKLIPLYESVVDKFTRPMHTINNIYTSVTAVHKTTPLDVITECESLEDLSIQQAARVQTTVLQCVSQGTRACMLSAGNAAHNIREKARELMEKRSCTKAKESSSDSATEIAEEADESSVEQLQRFAEQQLASLEVNATRVANDAYLCFTRQTAVVAKEIAQLVDRSQDCITSFSEQIALVSKQES